MEQKCNREKLKHMEQEYGLPFYLFDEKQAMENVQSLSHKLQKKALIAYAMKANPWIIKGVIQIADYLEVCSEGELYICEKYGIPGNKIILDGILKERSMLEKAVELGVRRISIDSKKQLELLLMLLGKEQEQEILFRLSSGNNFGMVESELQECVQICQKKSNIKAVGIQYYPGTQRKEVRQVKDDIQKLLNWVEICQNIQDFEVIEFGLGIGAPYFINETREEFDPVWKLVSDCVEKLAERYEVVYEAGRNIAASCGIYVTKIFEEKYRNGKKILFCKGGSNHLKYPGGVLGVRTPVSQCICETYTGTTETCMVCGSLCSESDVLIRDCSEFDAGITIGDYIIFFNTGAYSATETPNLFLTMEMPAVLLYNNLGLCRKIEVIRDCFPTYKLIDNRMW